MDQNGYKVQYDVDNTDECEVIRSNLFDRMTRWHANSHLSDGAWLEHFRKITARLGVQGRMFEDETLKKFVKVKMKKTALIDKYAVPEILEFLLPAIRKLYQDKINENEEEFSCKIVSMTGKEIAFYQNIFEPSALFYTYKEEHSDAPALELLQDLFTTGSGSETKDLFPEVTGVCEFCIQDVLGKEVSSPGLISDQINFKVFTLQVTHKFFNPSLWSSQMHNNSNEDLFVDSEELVGDDEDDQDGFVNPFRQDEKLSEDFLVHCKNNLEVVEVDEKTFEDTNSESDDTFVNPFLNNDELLCPTNFPCNFCKISFSDIHYLTFHNEVFHQKTSVVNKILKLQFVEDGEILMKSFSKDISEDVESSVSTESGEHYSKIPAKTEEDKPAKTEEDKPVKFDGMKNRKCRRNLKYPS